MRFRKSLVKQLQLLKRPSSSSVENPTGGTLLAHALLAFTPPSTDSISPPFTLRDLLFMSVTEKPSSKKPERPIWPTYSWRTKSINTQLFYIRDHRQADLAIVKLRKGPLGFDLELRPNFIKGQLENPVALVQISNEDTILLIQICAMTGT
jgi:hypothetical protein